MLDQRSKLLRALRATEYEPFAARRTSSRNVVQPHCSAAVGTAGVLPIGCSDLNKLNWGIAPLLAPTNSQQRNLFRDWFCHDLREQLAGAHVRFTPQSGHVQCTRRCLLCANSGHRHYSIVSSACASSVGGMVRPSVFAVFRLMTSSNLTVCCTGNSPGT